MNILLCGASDLKALLPVFEKTVHEMGFTAQNFMSGTIVYNNYGNEKWTENSKATVEGADIVVFVVNESHGVITWGAEYNQALKNGKNFIVLCLEDTYKSYRYIKDKLNFNVPAEEPESTRNMLRQIDLLESMHQITIITYDYHNFDLKLRGQIMNILASGLKLCEKNNQKLAFLPILKSYNYTELLKKHVNDLSEEISRDILFDIFEMKALRNRAIDYFKISKTLSDDELIRLLSDNEDSICRKVVAGLSELISDKNDKNNIFAAVIENSTENDVGIIRRAISSLFNIDLNLAIKHLKNAFPCNDVGTPKRIIAQIESRLPEIKRLIQSQAIDKNDVLALVTFCLNYRNDGKEWKEVGNSLLTEIQEISSSN